MTRLNYSLSDALPSLPKSGMPVTIITGFLGSGKTTLLNQILLNKDNLKIAVLVNEFGDINIDEQLLTSVETDMVELDNGCICCTINDSLVDAVYRVLEREEKVDYLIIETTGLADPLPIILNKIDLAKGEKISELKSFLEEIKPGFRILPSEYGKVPLSLILDIGLTQIDDYQAKISEFRRDKSAFKNHLRNDGFNFVSFKSEHPFEIEKFEHFLTQKLSNHVFRAKGILWFQESPARHIFQLSGPRYDLQADDWTSQPKNELVFIGRNLEESLIQEQLNECLAALISPNEFSLPNLPW